jgi:hypothetical protein
MDNSNGPENNNKSSDIKQNPDPIPVPVPVPNPNLNSNNANNQQQHQRSNNTLTFSKFHEACIYIYKIELKCSISGKNYF